MRLAPRLSDDRRFTWHVDLRLIIFAFVVLLGMFAAVACNHRATDHASTGSAAERLQPITNAPPVSGIVRRTVYVPICSSLYLGRDIKNDIASVEFVVKEADTAGGPGADFLVKWSGPSGVDEPLIEAVMLGRSANAGMSFTSAGRVITNEPQ